MADSLELAVSYIGHGCTLLPGLPASNTNHPADCVTSRLRGCSCMVFSFCSWQREVSPSHRRDGSRVTQDSIGTSWGMLGCADVTGSLQFSFRSGWLRAGRKPQIRLQRRWGHLCFFFFFLSCSRKSAVSEHLRSSCQFAHHLVSLRVGAHFFLYYTPSQHYHRPFSPFKGRGGAKGRWNYRSGFYNWLLHPGQREAFAGKMLRSCPGLTRV